MTNYKQSDINSGAAWTRAYQVLVENPYNQIPTITFNEEEIVDTGTTVMSKHVYALQKEMTDPSATFDIINPIDGSVIGTSSYQEVYVLLSSLYIALAAERDANIPA